MTALTEVLITSSPAALLAAALGAVTALAGPVGLVAALMERRWARLRKRALALRPAVLPRSTRPAATSRKVRQHKRGDFL